MSNLARILGKPNGKPSFSPDNRWILPMNRMGVEFEYEGVTDDKLPHHTYADFFEYHEEPSLKDHGAEYVFANPLFGADAFNAIKWITEYAASQKWKCSKRTGIHVHLDVLDLEAPQLAGMTILYATLEPLLYKWIGDGRETSHFCLPLYAADDALVKTCTIIRSALQDANSGSSTAIVQAGLYQRYAGFNLNALNKFGTIEFRQLQTTHNLNKIVDWINMLMAIKAAAFKLPTSDGAVIRMMEQLGVLGTLNYVFPLALSRQLYNAADSEVRFQELGLPNARDIAIHGCNSNAWINIQFPKGENPGFISWIKSQKAAAKKPKVKEENLNLQVNQEWGFVDDGGDVVQPEPNIVGQDLEQLRRQIQLGNRNRDRGLQQVHAQLAPDFVPPVPRVRR